MKVALTVAGSDSGGGAGIQADILTMAAMGVFATSAITSLTAQNPNSVSSIEPVSPNFLRAQLESVASYFNPKSAKTGMIFSAELARVCVDFFKAKKNIELVVDPVMISTSGSVLLDKSASKILIENLAPISKLVTPNLHEACYILSCKKIGISQMGECAKKLSKILKTSVLLKGGHLEGESKIIDVLFENGNLYEFESDRIDGVNTHGSGCTLSAAIAAQLALGNSLYVACKNARDYLYKSLKNPLSVAGENFINHKV